METTFLALAAMVILWLALIITGRIYDKISGNNESSWQEDATAASVVVGVSALAAIVILLMGLPIQFIYLVYFGLCYRVFQMDGITDIAFFYFLHGLILVILHSFGFIQLIVTVLDARG